VDLAKKTGDSKLKIPASGATFQAAFPGITAPDAVANAKMFAGSLFTQAEKRFAKDNGDVRRFLSATELHIPPHLIDLDFIVFPYIY
jgi:hypothetical protein